MLDQWHSARTDKERAGRLTLGLVFGAVVLGAAGYGATFVQAAPPPPEEPETEIEVALIEAPEEPESEPEPAPAIPEENPAPPAPRRGPPPPPAVTDIPDGAKQADPFDLPGGSDGPSGPPGPSGPGGTGTAPVAPPPPPPPPAPAPKPKAPPPPNPADYHPAKCKQTGMPSAQAKAIGVEGRVVVKFTVTTSGSVINVTAMSGPAELRDLAVSTVSKWSCQPARMKADDSPVQITKSVPMTVRLKTD